MRRLIRSAKVGAREWRAASYIVSFRLPNFLVFLQMAEKAFAGETLSERFADVRRRIAAAASNSDRSPKDITLIAISKTHPTETLRAAIAAGVTELGENRIQEAEEKILELGRQAARWHLVGHLQTNKARRAVTLFDCIHSLDSRALAERLDRLCIEEGRAELPVLIQINFAGEKSKTGIDPRELPELLKATADCERLRLIGLMTLPPYFENPDCVRPFFVALRNLRDRLRSQGNFGERSGELSMGMSHDFEVAIAEGATMVRVGTAIFGERSPAT
ncbi:MAG: dependent protein [Pyrinomonadaceae bacterium]|nr:dependent protein [Pyrinomonadaceae bacterium]